MKGTLKIAGSLVASLVLLAAIAMLVLSLDSGTAQAQTIYRPDNVTLTPRSGGIVMSWSMTNQVDAIDYYKIRWRELDGDWQQTLFFSSHTHHTIWGLKPETTYEVEVQGWIDDLEGPWSFTASATTPDGPQPPPPPIFRGKDKEVQVPSCG